jgi:hypothetical protein
MVTLLYFKEKHLIKLNNILALLFLFTLSKIYAPKGPKSILDVIPTKNRKMVTISQKKLELISLLMF